MAHPIELFYDVVSPYSYLASTQIEAVAERAGSEVIWRPFLLGAVMKATGNQPPATLPARAVYLFQDLHRWAKHYGVPFHFPAAFPINTLAAQRALSAVQGPERSSLTRRLFAAYWVEGRDLSQPAVLAELLGPEQAVAAGGEEAKAALKAATDDAISRGAFGAPTLFVNGEMFFGNDRLHFVEAAARGG